MFGELYAIERALPPLLPPSDDPVQGELQRPRQEQRRQLRQRDAGLVWDELSKWRADQKPGALPKSPLGTAIGYASNNWNALTRVSEPRGILAGRDPRGERGAGWGRPVWAGIRNRCPHEQRGRSDGELFGEWNALGPWNSPGAGVPYVVNVERA